MSTLQSILVPVDGSTSSLAALDHAVALARDYDATIEVLYVVEDNDPISPEARDEAEQAMDAAIEQARSILGATIVREIMTGQPVRAIVERAGDGFDLIVMGTHGRSGRLHAMLGSVAETVVRNAPCPVLTVRDASGYQSFAERRHGRPTLAEQVAHTERL